VINRKELKAEARLGMKGRNPSVLLVAFVYQIIVYVLDVLSLKISMPGISIPQILEYSEDAEALYEMIYDSMLYSSTSFLGSIISLALGIMMTMIGVGMTAYCLRVSRDQEAGFGDLFEVFGIFFRMLWLQILVGIFTMLWSLLFIIPGIIAGYRYSMAVYIMLDNPDMTALECIRASKEMTRGYKGSLFVLELSFIGWSLLTIIPIAGFFVGLFLNVYVSVTFAKYYNVLSAYQPGAYEAEYTEEREPWER